MNSNNKHPIFIADRFGEILEHTSVDQWNHVANCNNATYTGILDMSANALESNNCVRGPYLMRT